MTDMADFVKIPNLPSERVSTVLCGIIPYETEKLLKRLEINILKAEKSRLLGENVSGHIDLQCIHLGNNRLLLSSEQIFLRNKLEKKGFDVELFDGLGKDYPLDCLVNVALIGKFAVCKKSIIHPLLSEFLIDNGYTVINTNQGYSGCSVCVVDEKSIITEDESIKNACEKQGIDVLLIHKGYIKLKGFNYGFIGGASFKIDKNTLVFNGDIEGHPDYYNIKAFTLKKSIDIIGSEDYPLTDIGGVIPLI